MSEKSKGDTSTAMQAQPLRAVKNPLLSASVTGLTYNDFSSAPLLLPAAPPIITPSTIQPITPTAGIINRESKSLVTVANPVEDTDIENLDEINLNSSGDDHVASSESDNNANTIWNQSTINSDSILSQAATSFSALPSVASNVLSTFSKRIYSSREQTPDNSSQDTNSNLISSFDIQQQQQQQQEQNLQQFQHSSIVSTIATVVPPPPSIFQTAAPISSNTVSSNLYESTTTSSSSIQSAPPENLCPPKFYTPSEVPAPSLASSVPPFGGQNSYRLSAKKKLYAPIPGLSGAAQQSTPIIDGTQNTTNNYYQQQIQQKPEDRGRGGIFSFTNLVPTGVLQNISGLVQSAADTITQSVKSDPSDPSNQNLFPQPVNYPYGGGIHTPSSGVAVPPPVLYPSAAEAASSFLIPSDNSATTAPLFPLQNPIVDGNNLAQQSFASVETNTIPFFNPSAVAAKTQSSDNYQASLTNFTVPGGVNTITVQPQPPVIENLNPQTATTTVGSAPPPLSFHSSTSNSAVPPPAPVAPPPISGQTSFRLQKGTRLYKSPLTPTETALQNPVVEVNSSAQQFFGSANTTNPISFFNPLAPVVDNCQITSNLTTPSNILQTEAKQPVGTPLSSAAQKVPAGVNINTAPPVIEFVDPSTTVSSATPPPPLLQSSTLNSVAPPLSSPSSQISQQPGSASVQPPPPQISQPGSVSVQPPPPQVSQSLPPPISGQTSFRLQKGTRLYQSPVTILETTPALVPLTASNPIPQPTEHIFNPFNSNIIEPTAETSPQTSSNPVFVSNYFEPATDTSACPIFGANESVKSQDSSEPQTEQSAIQSVELFATPEDQQEVKLKYTEESNLAASNKDHDQQQHITSEELLSSHISDLQNTTSSAASIIEATVVKEQEQSVPETSVTGLTSELLSKPNELAAFLPPPPHSSLTQGQTNPYRKGLAPNQPTGSVAAPSLANFFTPAPTDRVEASSSSDLNFFNIEQPQQVKASNTESLSSSSSTLISSFFNSSQITNQTEPSLLQLEALKTQENIQPLPKDFSEQEISQPAAVIAPPIGFDNIVSQVKSQQEETQQTDSSSHHFDDISNSNTQTENIEKQSVSTANTNSFSNYFNKSTIEQQEHQSNTHTTDPVSFFDSIARQNSISQNSLLQATAPTLAPIEQLQQESQTTSVTSAAAAKEDQRIQNFFNNPPPQENGSGTGDLNYDLVHRGLAIKNLETRSLTPISNLVEPPSSTCSEFSELNNSLDKLKLINKANIENNKAAVNLPPISVETKEECPASGAIESSDTITTTNYLEELPEEILHELRMANLLTSEKGAASAPPSTVLYTPAIKHWFYKRLIGTKHVWIPFSHYDSALLETSLNMGNDDSHNLVAVEGGRYDVNIRERTKTPVYWEGQPIEVRRCSWFYKAVDSKYVPYEERTADLLEAEYKQAADSGVWHKKVTLSMGEQVVFHAPAVIVHFQQQQAADAWGGTSQSTTRPRVVKRGLEDFTIDQGESQRVDHLLFMVHGIGSACDLKMRTVEEVVEDFRSIAQQLVQSHYKNSTEMGLVGRVEVLPISWYSHLHSEELGIDEKLKSITLESIPRLRKFTNDTLLDILFYTSPKYCQKIMNTVAASMNSVYMKYRERHPDFNGGVSLAGHSLGSLIVFDLLCHQKPLKESEDHNMENPDEQFSSSNQNQICGSPPESVLNSPRNIAKQISYTMGHAGTGQPFIHYAQLMFQPKKFFALGSPIGMFVTIRGIDNLGLDFRLPTCAGFYNIFHPFDPVAYRIEALVNPDMSGIRPVLIPHHKGRKRMHLELKETMTRVGADLKQRFIDTFKNTLESVNFLGAASTSAAKSKKEEEESMEKEVNKVYEMQMELEQHIQDQKQEQSNSEPSRSRADSTSTFLSDLDIVEIDFPLGKLNDSKRIDYVLQEAPLEFINEYLFALSSHVCYWESEDTILFVVKEIYSGLGISPDSQVPQQTMTIERPSSSNSVTHTLLSPM